MNAIRKTHQIDRLRQSSQHLRDKSKFAERQATHSATQVRSAIADLSALKMDEIFDQLHEMINLIGGRRS